MSDVGELIAVVQQGDRCQRLLEDPEIASAFKEIEGILLQGITMSQPGDREGRESLYFQHLGLQAVVGLLHQRVAGGLSAQEQLNLIIEEEENNG